MTHEVYCRKEVDPDYISYFINHNSKLFTINLVSTLWEKRDETIPIDIGDGVRRRIRELSEKD